MNKILNKGKVLVTYVSVLAILAVSVLSVFSGATLGVFAQDDTAGTTTAPEYPLNKKYDADYTEVKEAGISYETVDTKKKTKIDKFTGYDVTFCVDENTEGDGTANNPYIIKTANQFAAVVTGNLKDGKGSNANWIDTEGLYFKIADDIYGFNLNNTGSTVDFSKDNLTASQVEAELKKGSVKTYKTDENGDYITDDKGNMIVDKDFTWLVKNPFKGRFDGNGACVFGLKADSTYAAIFPRIGGNITVKNLTVKNCYFVGKNVSAFFGENNNSGGGKNTKHIMLNCQAYNNSLVCTFDTDEAIQKCGIFIGQTTGSTESNLVVTDCLVYGNTARHAQNDDDDTTNRNIKYGLVGNLHRSGSLTITSSIIMDAAPHALYYGSNAHLTSTYNHLYTNEIGKKWENIDNYKNGDPVKYVYDYSVSKDNVPQVKFNHYDKTGKNLTNNGSGYDKVLKGSVVFVKTPNDIKAAKALDGISAERWTYNANGYPTPKIYRVREYSAGTNWSGEQAVQFGEGDGTKGSPFTVATAEELVLMLTKPVTGSYYKLVANIAINDTTGDWTKKAKTWFTSNDVPTFEASLDGNGYTVSGLYYDGTQVGEYAGLIPVLGATAEIRNITIADSVIKANKGAAGAIAGAIADNCSSAVKFDACVINDTVKFEGKALFGGMIGKSGYSMLHINDCISMSNGFVNTVTGEAKVKRSISIGAYPFADTTYVKPENVFTDTKGEKTLIGVKVLSNSNMKGNAAAINMEALTFNSETATWRTTDGYPLPTGIMPSSEGEVGQVWSGAIATGFASGTGTKEDPYIIKTAEQLAYFIYTGIKPTLNNYAEYVLKDKDGKDLKDEKGNKLYSEDCPYYTPGHKDQGKLKYDADPAIHQKAIKYVKLDADIYLNDVNSRLWKDKIGGTNWFTQRTTASYANMSHVNFDGDGHVIHGLFFDCTKSTDEYVRVGLFPMAGVYTTIENVGLANAYLAGRTAGDIADSVAGLVGCTDDFDSFLGLDTHDAAGNKEKLADEKNDYENMALKFKSCFIDHNSYISGYYTGGFIATPFAAPIIENCIFTGKIGGHEDQYYTGILTGADSSYGSQIRNTIVFPTTDSVNLVGGSCGASWRSNPNYHVTHATNVYFFSLKQQYGAAFTKITNPQHRFGELAMQAMPGLDWAGNTEDGTNDYWTAIDGCTPLPTIFTKGRTQKEIKELACSKFDTPIVTVEFVTGASEKEVEVPEPIEGEMYSKDDFILPVLEREGYNFTGWYVFSDCSIEYPHDYFPPRNLILYAGWEEKGVIQNFERYPDSIWDYDSEYWQLNKPGAKGGYKNKYVRGGSKSIHLLGNKPEPSDCLLNYEDMLVPGTAYTISFWVATDKNDNPPTLLSLVHNNYPDYLDTGIALENMAVVAGLKVKEGDEKWTKYTYSFTAKTQWVSIRATGNSSLYIDDIVIESLDGVLSDGKVISLGNGGTLSPGTADGISISVLICALMTCAAVAVISRKNLTEVIED